MVRLLYALNTIKRQSTLGGKALERTDEELLRSAADGNEAGFSEIVRRYQSGIYRFLLRFLDSSDDAEQAALNVFIRAWEHAPRFQYRSKVSTWLYKIAYNIACDMHRRRKDYSRWQEIAKTEIPTIHVEQEALEKIGQEVRHRQLQDGLQKLPEMDRLLITLYYYEDRSYEEMQEISGLSYKVLKTRLTRARQRLRALVEEDNQETAL